MSEDKNKTWKLQKSIKLGDGYEYLGEVNLESGKPHGQGTKTRIGGEEQVGEFKDGNFVQGKVIQASSTECAIEFNDKDDSACDAITMALAVYGKVIFANGGDRHNENTPEYIKFKDDDRVEFRWAVGGSDKKNSSSWILERWGDSNYKPSYYQ